MLQAVKSQPTVEPSVARVEIASPTERLASATSFARRQLSVIVFVTLLTCALGMVYIFTTPPSYTAQATIIIDTRKVQISQQPTIVGDNVINAGMVESQVEILKSENISFAVIKKLRLTDDPEFVRFSGGLVGSLLALVEATTPTSEFELMQRAAHAFANGLTVRRIGLTYIIEINFRSESADRAAQVANAIAEEYLAEQQEAKYQAAKRATVWLEDRIRELGDRASLAQQAVVEFNTTNNIVNTGSGGRRMDEDSVAEVNSQLVVARAQTSEARAKLNRIEAVLRADSPNATVDATVADTLKNDVITKLRSQYVDLANQEADWSARYGRDHLAAVHLQNQMREIRNSIGSELQRIAETYKSDYEIAKQREESIKKELAQAVSQSQTTNQARVTLRELESNAQTYRTLYDNFLQHYIESVQEQSAPITEARVVTRASRPITKSHPKTLLIFAITAVGGLMLSLGIAGLRDLLDRVFRTSAQVEASLQMDCLAVLPNVSYLKAQRAFSKLSIDDISAGPTVEQRGANRDPIERDVEGAGSRVIKRNNDLLWYVVDKPLSRFAESIRSIKMAVDFNGANKSNKIIGITSALPNEGKSTTATSLAQLMAHTGARTILVDCDLRNPWLTRELAPNPGLGILDVICGEASPDDVVWTDRTGNLIFLPAIVNPCFPHTSEILASERAKKLFERLRESYDYVIADLSPLAPVVDARGTTHFVDSYIFVIEWGRSRRDAVQRILNESRGIYDKMLGAVLNRANVERLSRYEGYSYYRNKYLSGYYRE